MLQDGADLGRADRQRGARSQHLLDEPRIRSAFEAFCCGLAVSACPTCLRLARSRLWLARRSTAPRRCRRSRQVLVWSRPRRDLVDRSHGGSVPSGECLTPYELYLILELAHCGLYHRRSSRFSATIAVVRCRPRRNTAPALDPAQTGASGPMPPSALGSLETLSAAPSQRGRTINADQPFDKTVRSR